MILTGAYFMITLGCSLRGNEVLWVDTDLPCQHIEVCNTDGRSTCLLVPLVGRFKEEDEDRMYVFPISNDARSGIHVCLWVEGIVNIFKI